jgi:hypothetical protein
VIAEGEAVGEGRFCPSCVWNVGIGPSPSPILSGCEVSVIDRGWRAGCEGGADTRLEALGLDADAEIVGVLLSGSDSESRSGMAGSSEYERDKDGAGPSAYSRIASVIPHCKSSSQAVNPAGVTFAEEGAAVVSAVVSFAVSGELSPISFGLEVLLVTFM